MNALTRLRIVIATGAGASSRRILGSTVMGGMLTATLIAIFIIPVTFYFAERFAPKPKPKAGAEVPTGGATPAPIHGGAADEHERAGRNAAGGPEDPVGREQDVRRFTALVDEGACADESAAQPVDQ